MSQRRRSLWRAIALACLVALLSPLRSSWLAPISLVAVPAAVRLLAFGRRDREGLLLAAGLLGLSALGAGGAGEPWYLERGWAVLLAGGFGVSQALFPERTLFARAGLAVLIAGAAVALLGAVRPDWVAELEWRVTGGWEVRLAPRDLGGRPGSELAEAMRLVAGAVEAVLPARLVLASLAALGCAAWVAGRMEGEAEPLGPMRRFRFSDHLVWALVGGLGLVVAPLGLAADRVGLNLATVMGGLYAARGAAVLAWAGMSVARSGWSIGLWTLAAVVLYPVTIGAAFVIGLSDTWLDLRSRWRVEAEGD